ncbi:MAG: thiamine phosphate synthase [Candidatus Electrothrix sp. AW2]|nr:thiamine phosphate synthase [Candidatus Electrothrix sp. AX1]MCI5128892.1 thiamine phosphate synthase [Candidatus Electrothrix gigas]MCI5135613.1 thiamine phosphate synthase [Candidatus Electrothrix gigas]MCI5181562.1 thiamine phosphate synthase [Candidatus Electrothrix gigas]MCI5195857.1 thiamine phosphate synthase [Candidatus Electrothrix gigas]
MNQNRLLDANINRSAEGLRVLEDIARFSLDNQKISAAIRSLRHRVRDLFKGREHSLLSARDSVADVGQITSQQATGSDERDGLRDTVLSNFKRVQEASRSIEEILKTKGEYSAGKIVEELRFSVYELETELMSFFSRQLPSGIYGILGEKFSLGRSNVEVARQMVEAGVAVLQYREKLKYKSSRAIYEECLAIREITREAGIPFIVNDYADIALMVEADGIHQGQDDIPIKALRKIAPDIILGCSTHSPEQAQQAIADGADYIGVGPIFTTQTKEDVCDAVGLEYLEYVAKNHDIPFVAIGGIKRNNLPQVLQRGAKTVCLVTEIIGARDINKRIQEIQEIFNAGEEK